MILPGCIFSNTDSNPGITCFSPNLNARGLNFFPLPIVVSNGLPSGKNPV